MFSETESCPYIFSSNWTSHEDSCAAAYHNCITCYHCMADIYYWGMVDEILQTTESPAAHPYSNPYELNQPDVQDTKSNATDRSPRSKISAAAGAHSSQVRK